MSRLVSIFLSAVCVLDCCICSSNIAQYEWLTKQKIKPLARPASPNNAIFYGYWIWKQKNYWQNGENIQRQIHRKYISQLRSAVLSVSNNIILKLTKSRKYGHFHTFAAPPQKNKAPLLFLNPSLSGCFKIEELLIFFCICDSHIPLALLFILFILWQDRHCFSPLLGTLWLLFLLTVCHQDCRLTHNQLELVQFFKTTINLDQGDLPK